MNSSPEFLHRERAKDSARMSWNVRLRCRGALILTLKLANYEEIFNGKYRIAQFANLPNYYFFQFYLKKPFRIFRLVFYLIFDFA